MRTPKCCMIWTLICSIQYQALHGSLEPRSKAITTVANGISNRKKHAKPAASLHRRHRPRPISKRDAPRCLSAAHSITSNEQAQPKGWVFLCLQKKIGSLRSHIPPLAASKTTATQPSRSIAMQGRAGSPTPHCVPARSAENYRDFSLNIYAFIPHIPHIILCIAAFMQ